MFIMQRCYHAPIYAIVTVPLKMLVLMLTRDYADSADTVHYGIACHYYRALSCYKHDIKIRQHTLRQLPRMSSLVADISATIMIRPLPAR